MKNKEIRALGDVALIQKGKTITAKLARPGNVPVIAGGMKPAYFHDEANRPANCITVSASGNAGYVAFHRTPIYASDCITIQAIDNKTVLNDYIYYYLKSKQQEIYGFQQGSGVPHVYSKDLVGLEIPIPSLDEQQRIVENLDAIFGKSAEFKSILEKKTEFLNEAQALLRDYLLAKYSNMLAPVALGDVAVYVNGKAHEMYVDEDGEFQLVNSKFISTGGSVAKSVNKALSPLNRGDIAIVLSDVPNGKALAKCFLVPESGVYTLNQRIAKVSSELLIPEFFHFVLNRSQFLLDFNNGENQTNLRLQDILDTPLVMASVEVQKQIVEEAKSVSELISDAINGQSKLNELNAEYLHTVLANVFSEEINVE